MHLLKVNSALMPLIPLGSSACPKRPGFRVRNAVFWPTNPLGFLKPNASYMFRENAGVGILVCECETFISL
jgi:hypothetical protein